MFLVLGEVLRAHIFNLVELFVVFFLQAFAMRTYSSSDISNECFYILTFLLYLVLKFQAARSKVLLHSMRLSCQSGGA